MSNRKNTKRALFSSVMSLILCISMLLGSTYAWFTDTATANVNLIQSGELKVDLVDENDDTLVGKSLAFQKAAGGEGEQVLWEPGVTYETQKFYVKNEGNLALKYKLAINGLDGDYKLLKVIDFYLVDENGNEYSLSTEKNLVPKAKSGALKLVGKMKTTANNEYQGLTLDGISVTVYATQASGDEAESDSYGNLYDQLANYAIFATKSKTLTDGSTSLDFVMSYEGLTIANISVPASAIADTSKPVTVTIDAIDPEDTISVDANTKAYAYDIEVTNLKENLSAEQEVSVVLTAPNALPAANVYHNGTLIGDATYEEVNGSVAFTTDSFSPFAVSYIEYEVATLEELRKAVAVDNAYIKLTADISAQMNKSVDGHACDVAHSWSHSSYKNTENTYYFLALITGVSVTIDLNGHEVKTTDQLNDGYMWCGSIFTVDYGASLNLTDTVGTGKIKAVGPHTIVWAPYADASWCDIYGGIYMSDSYVDDKFGWGYPYNETMIYAGYDDDIVGNINVYGGYYLYNNFPNDDKNNNNGAFNCGDKCTKIGLVVHDGVMLINQYWRQSTGTDDDSVALADGCEVVEVTLDTPMTIDGVEYATWYQVQKALPEATMTELTEEQQSVLLGGQIPLTMDTGVSFAADANYKDDPNYENFKDWNCDFTISFNKSFDSGIDDNNQSATLQDGQIGFMLTGSYQKYQNGTWMPLRVLSATKDQPIRVMKELVGPQITGSDTPWSYDIIAGTVQEFNCGIRAVYDNSFSLASAYQGRFDFNNQVFDTDGADKELLNGMTVTVELRMYEVDDLGNETGESFVVKTYEYTYDVG